MMSKKPLAYAAIFIVCTAGVLEAWVLNEQKPWPVYVWFPAVLLILWAMWTLRTPPDPKAKAFDFNPKRGLEYFILGLFIFPVVAALNAAFGGELSFRSVLIFTAICSTTAGIAGVFTEDVGI